MKREWWRGDTEVVGGGRPLQVEGEIDFSSDFNGEPPRVCEQGRAVL